MAGLVFEGDTNSVSKTQQEYIIEVLQKRRYKYGKICIEPVGKAGDNYVANVKRVIVNNNGRDIFKMIAKVAPTNEFARASGIPVWFRNESVLYGEIFPKFKELQQKLQVDESYLLRVPECYGILSEEPNELILLEDLEPLGFVIEDKAKPLQNGSVKCILKKFAVYHSLSFIMREKNPCTFENSSKKLYNIYCNMNKMPGFDQYLATVLNNSKAIINDNDYGKVFDVLTQQWPTLLEKLTKDEETSKYTVIIHGDAWINNVLFKHKDDGQVDCVLIDYQQSKLGSPACDVLHVICTSTDHETRHKYFNEWMAFYHSELDKCLANHGFKVSEVYSRNQYDADIRTYSKVYFVVGFLMFALMFIKPEDAAAFKELADSASGEDMNAVLQNAADIISKINCLELRSRLVGLVDSFREFGFIDF